MIFLAEPCDFLSNSCSNASNTSTNSQNSSSKGEIIGGVVGGFFLLLFFLAVAAIVFFILHKSKTTNNAIKKSLSVPTHAPPRFSNIADAKDVLELNTTSLNYVDIEVNKDVKDSYMK